MANLPRIYTSRKPQRLLHAYELKEDIAAGEGLVRNLPVFSDFPNMAARSDSEPVNFSTIARDCGVSSQTVKQYFQILGDTLLGRWLPDYRKRPKRRVSVYQQKQPKQIRVPCHDIALIKNALGHLFPGAFCFFITVSTIMKNH